MASSKIAAKTVPGIAPADDAAVEVAAAAFCGIQRGAATGVWDDFVDLLAEDVRIMIPVPATEENAPEGVLRGRDVARRMFSNRHVEKVQGARLEGKRIAANGPLVVIESRVEGNLGGEDVANHFIFVFEVRDGEISSMYEYASWTAKSAHSGWSDPTFARDAFDETVLPFDAASH
ncbi:nuclear transport factor 2 family protein [Saccharopolyspora phatthalungensis]|uniref:Ketosteroid isomerase-like protein n=1 Tax=Saccharopolyspora phatthalungensis TaxID=664693 RepID=A0A840Q899_9PSEU|nr:nuclear transport factor 2 family protein [Saccharopolyspora phatthalungensis]MBB5156954.1 ketosteroid isomerase-like protein [Saccharopolyspora phatthalungensis]